MLIVYEKMSDKKWQWVVQRMTTNGNKWPRLVHREEKRLTKNDNDWQWVTANKIEWMKRSLLNRVLGMPACLRVHVLDIFACLRAYVLEMLAWLCVPVFSVLSCLRACMLILLSCLACLSAWRPCVLAYSRVRVLSRLDCFMSLRAYMSYMLSVLKYLKCLRGTWYPRLSYLLYIWEVKSQKFLHN